MKWQLDYPLDLFSACRAWLCILDRIYLGLLWMIEPNTNTLLVIAFLHSCYLSWRFIHLRYRLAQQERWLRLMIWTELAIKSTRFSSFGLSIMLINLNKISNSKWMLYWDKEKKTNIKYNHFIEEHSVHCFSLKIFW